MKIRTGFVSNSSSSSFCLLGINQCNIPTEKDIDFYEIETFLETEYGIDNYYDETIIGIDPSNIKENETIGEAKQRIVDEINKIYETDIKQSDISWFVDGGYEG